MVASSNGQTQCVKLLLNHNSDIKIKSKKGKNALDMALSIVRNFSEISRKINRKLGMSRNSTTKNERT